MGKKINYGELLNIIAKKTGFKTKDVKKITDAFVDEIKNLLYQKISVLLRGFVKFSVEPASQKRAYNFAQKSVTVSPVRYLPKAKFVKSFSNKVKKS